ncbi:MAG: host attachment protein [Silicimonas sp.]|nr:host attachment protein [Silicimonas sp.]
MKPVVTWILLASTRHASVAVNHGPGKGLALLSGKEWTSQEADLPRDRAGMGHSIGGHGVSAVGQADPQKKIDADFAQAVARGVAKALKAKEFDRLIIVAGPHMLGLLRAELDHESRAVLLGEIDKDLTGQPMPAVASHVEGLIVV